MPKKTIGFATFKVHKPWDPDSVKTGITGSEEAIIYMSQKLANLGYDVIVFGDPPKDSPHAKSGANPRFVDISEIRNSFLDILISWRMPQAGRQLKQFAKTTYLWPHDPINDKVAPEDALSFDEVLWNSKWQRLQWCHVNPVFSKFEKVFGNGINPDQFNPVRPRENPYSCIYGSNYAAGLEVLFDIWPTVKTRFPRATLDLYYGWKHWGMMSNETEARMRKKLPELVDVKEHGLVSHEEIARAYETAAFWTYPCTINETFCISGLKAQLAGAVPVIITGSAFKETVRSGYQCSHVSQYFDLLLKALSEAETVSLETRQKMGEFINQEYTWEIIAARWAKLFESRLT